MTGPVTKLMTHFQVHLRLRKWMGQEFHTPEALAPFIKIFALLQDDTALICYVQHAYLFVACPYPFSSSITGHFNVIPCWRHPIQMGKLAPFFCPRILRREPTFDAWSLFVAVLYPLCCADSVQCVQCVVKYCRHSSEGTVLPSIPMLVVVMLNFENTNQTHTNN